MKAKDMSRPDDFIEISGSKMRKLAAQGAKPCDVTDGKEIPSDLLAANCIPPGILVCSDVNTSIKQSQQSFSPYKSFHHTLYVLPPALSIPLGFMVQSGWEIVCDYYQHVESPDWVPYSVMNPGESSTLIVIDLSFSIYMPLVNFPSQSSQPTFPSCLFPSCPR